MQRDQTSAIKELVNDIDNTTGINASLVTKNCFALLRNANSNFSIAEANVEE
jgi:hypothetical protein